MQRTELEIRFPEPDGDDAVVVAEQYTKEEPKSQESVDDLLNKLTVKPMQKKRAGTVRAE